MAMRLWTLVLALGVSVGVAAGLPASAQSLSSFAKDEHYLGRSGTPPTPEQFAASPQTYLRNQAAVAALAAHLDVPPEQLGAVVAELSLEPCNGRRIETAGLTTDGNVGWSTRECYKGEQLLVRTSPSGERTVVASLGCLNPVRRVIAPHRPTPPPAKAEWGVMNTPPRTVAVPPLDVCGCYTLPGQIVTLPGSQMHPADW
jgi:hypothetical protein